MSISPIRTFNHLKYHQQHIISFQKAIDLLSQRFWNPAWQTPLLQNQKMVEVGRDLWRSFCPTPLFKQGLLGLVAQEHTVRAFDYLQGWRLHNIPRQPVPVFSHSKSKKVSPDIETWSVFQFVSICLCPCSLSITEKSLAWSSLHPPFRYLNTLMRSPWDFSLA